MEILAGVVGGIISGLGMGGGSVLIILLSLFWRSRATRCTSYEYCFFCACSFDFDSFKF